MVRYILLLLALAAQGQNLKLTLLGTTGPRPIGERAGPGILIEAGPDKLLFDCGRGTAGRLTELGVPFSDATALFITHLHSDHIIGIPDLWLTGWFLGRETPFRVWGPAGTEDMMANLEKAYAFDIRVRSGPPDNRPVRGVAVEAHDISEGAVYENRGVKVTAFLADHGPIRPALGYRIDFGGHSVVIPGDTMVSENLTRNSQGADVLIWDIGGNAPPLFSPLAEVAIFLNRVKPKLAIYTHYGSVQAVRERQSYRGEMVIGEDLMSFDIGEQVVVHPPGGTPTERKR